MRNYTRKLNQEQEREVALVYLCGVGTEHLKEKYGISNETASTSILAKRSHQWNDPLVEFYRQTNPHGRLKNSAHLYLAFHDGDIPQRELVDIVRDKKVYTGVQDNIYSPRTKEVIKSTALDRFIAPSNGFDMLLKEIFGLMPAERIVEPILVDRLNKEYQESKKFSLNSVYEDVRDALINKVKYGGIAVTPRKAEVIYDALRTLSPKEEHILTLLFGLGDKPKRFKEVQEIYGVGREIIRQIEAQALRKLKHPSRGLYILNQHQLITDNEINDYFANLKAASERPKEIEKIEIPKNPLDITIDELAISVRTYHTLKNANIKTIGEIAEMSEPGFSKLIRHNQVLKETKEMLSNLGLSFATDITKQPSGAEILYY